MSPMMYALIVAALIVFWAVASYNGLVRKSALRDEGWSGISVQLKRRHDLIPNLVASTKGLAAHEKELMESVTRARSLQSASASSAAKVADAENHLTQALGRFIAVAENYPEIKADSAFNSLMNQLSELENDLQMARRYYNGTARELNVAVRSFPTVIIAKMAGVGPAEFFELDSAGEAAAPEVKF